VAELNVATRQIKLALWDAAQIVWPDFPDTAAEPVSPGLRATLISTSITARQAVASGSIVFSSANGHVTKFAEGSTSVLTPADIAEVWVYLVEEFDRAKAELGEAASDAEVFALMERNLRPSLGYTDNYMFMSK
jgi:hypothetical protein